MNPGRVPQRIVDIHLPQNVLNTKTHDKFNIQTQIKHSHYNTLSYS